MQFERNLVLLRKKKGLSQEDLALALGISRQTVYTWEGGLNYPNILMLKKIAYLLEVSTDQLLNGYDVSKLPDKIDDLQLKYISYHSASVSYEEAPNWFIALKVGEEVNWAQYDDNKKDFSYHLSVVNRVFLHNMLGYEVLVEEYNKVLEKTNSYSLILHKENEMISYIGRIFFKDGIKNIETYHDQIFLDNWGVGEKNIGQSTTYNSAENFELIYDGKKYNVVKIGYFGQDESNDITGFYFEVFLNQNGESLFWRRFSKNHQSNTEITIEGYQYGLEYQCLTDRLR